LPSFTKAVADSARFGSHPAFPENAEIVSGHKQTRDLKQAENRTHLIVGLGFRGLRGPVDQPGTQRVRAGRRSPAWQVVLRPRMREGTNPAP